MRVLTIVPKCEGDDSARGLLKLAVDFGWATGEDNACKDPDVTLVPAEWGRREGKAPLAPYASEIDVAAGPGAGAGGALVIRNGRYQLQDGDDLAARLGALADIVAVTVGREQSAYSERLHVTGDGSVVGFRRVYRDAVVPAPMGDEWPHFVVLAPQAVETLSKGPVPAAFGLFVDAAKAAGLRVASFEAGGRARDLAREAGMLAFYAALANRAAAPREARGQIADSAKLFGDVSVGAGAEIADDAVVIGPTLLGEGCRVGRGALVRASIVAPGAAVAAGAVVTNRVVLAGSPPEANGGGGRLIEPLAGQRGAPGGYRQWALFSYARLGKRVFDVVFSLCALVVTATIFPLVAIAIKLTSRGPVFYGHRRQGRHGKVFRCLKFRTMVQDAHSLQQDLRAVNEVDGPQFKMENDPRVTLVGEFLRETNLDELPQFINVLKGDMSVVGPRPSPDAENQMCPWWREARLSVRPGVTGLWQVSRSRDRENDFQEWIHYDVLYVRRLTFWRDLVIIVRTFAVLGGAFAQLFQARPAAPEVLGTPDGPPVGGG